MRILLDYRPALVERTGVGEFVHELAKALAAGGHPPEGEDLALLTTSWKDRPRASLAAELPGVTIVDRRLPVRLLTWSWNRLQWPPVEWLAGPVDLVHAQTPLLIPSARAAQVITIHDLDFLAHPERSEREMRHDFPVLVRDHAGRADHVVVSSAYAAAEVQQTLGLGPEKVSVCPPGAPAWAASVARARDQAPTGAHLLFVGTLEPRKNVKGLLDAYERLRARGHDIPPLVLAGRARPSISDQLARVSRPPLRDCVRVLGYVTDAERQRLYREACLLVLPSFNEGFGLPVLEAMACGVPVVVSNRGSLPEVAGAAAQPVDPEDSDGLADAMSRLLDRDAALAASAAGRARAASFTWDACARAVRGAYRQAMAARARRGR